MRLVNIIKFRNKYLIFLITPKKLCQQYFALLLMFEDLAN